MTNLKLTLFIIFFLNGLICSAQTGGKTSDTQNDERIIDSQVNSMVSDWNTHQFKNMDQYATADVDWVNIVGMWWKGRADVEKAHQITFDHFFNKVPFTRKNLKIKFITNDVAIVHMICHVGSLFPPDGIDRVTNRTPETDDLLTLIYVKRNGTWLLSAGQNTTIDPKAAKSNPIVD